MVSDGKNVFPLDDAFITNAKKEEVNAALEKAFMPPDMLTIYFAPLVINTGGKLIVIDTGNGALAKANSKGATACSPTTWPRPASMPRRSTWW